MPKKKKSYCVRNVSLQKLNVSWMDKKNIENQLVLMPGASYGCTLEEGKLYSSLHTSIVLEQK